MKTYTEMLPHIEGHDYETHFWNAIRGKQGHKEHLANGIDTTTGAFTLTPKGQDNYMTAIKKEGLFRSLATDIQIYDHAYNIKTVEGDDAAIWVPGGGTLPITDGMADFSDIALESHKLAVFFKLEDALIHDPYFKVEDYLVKRLAKNFGRAEDNGFINGTGENMPTGILTETGGAEVGVTTDALTYDDVIKLFFSVKPEYRNVQVEQILLTEINRMLAFVRERESEFLELLTKKNERDLNRQFRECSRELEQATQRITKLDSIIQRLYEDNLDGKISDERFAKMTATYEQEQKDLQARVVMLRETISKAKAQRLNIDSFLAQVRKYTEVKELDAEIIRALVERIDVFTPEKVPGTRTKKQTILIHWNFIGAVELPQEQKKSA